MSAFRKHDLCAPFERTKLSKPHFSLKDRHYIDCSDGVATEGQPLMDLFAFVEYDGLSSPTSLNRHHQLDLLPHHVRKPSSVPFALLPPSFFVWLFVSLLQPQLLSNVIPP